jgi:peroxiredoxin
MAIAATMCVLGQGFTIVGEVIGNANGQTVSLRQYSSLRPVEISEIATTTVSGGRFTLSGNLSNPELYMLFVGEAEPIHFFAENANMQISVNIANIEQSRVVGSRENDVFMEFMSGLNTFLAQQRQLNDSFIALNTSGNATQEAIMSIRSQFEQLGVEQNTYMENFVFSNPGRIVSAYIAYVSLLRNLDILQIEHIVNGFDSRTSQSQWVKALSDRVATVRRTEVGQPFIDVTLKTPDDQSISISDFAGKGKYVLLDFWAAWCGPCRVANPHIVELYNRYKDRGFEIIGISLDQSKEAWIQAIRDDNLTWPQMSDLKFWQSEAAGLYMVSAIPHMILLDKEGKIIANGLHLAGLRTKLAELFDF